MMAILVAAASAVSDPMGVTAAVRDSCSAGDAQEVVVCGSREKSERYRLPKIAREYELRTIRAETKIGGVSTAIRATSVDLPDGQRSNRVMLSVGIGF